MSSPRRFSWLAALALAACGARTELEVEPCADGGTRACETVCGAGEQVCSGGHWSACVGPATAERACTNECGTGIETCSDETWSECVVPVTTRPCSTPCGEGIQMCTDGEWGRCSADRPLPPLLAARVRDFSSSHPDFEDVIAVDRGIVEARLDADDKPVYAGPTISTHGREAFDQWYRDVSGVNLGTDIEIELEESRDAPGLYVYDDLMFFPIDDALLGNEGFEHNFHFTLEAHTEIVYRGGEIFRFRGDDDVFVFINRVLAIDLGGVHSTEEATVDLDAVRDTLGIEPGGVYPIHLFFAERHSTGSTFTIETTLADAIRCE